MAFNIGIGLALDGEKEFKRGIGEVRSELKLLDSQAKLTDAEYAGSANTLKALTEKHNLLTKQLEAEEKKVALNRQELEAWQKVNKEAGARTQELKKQLFDAESAMDKMKSSSGATTQELEDQQKTVNELREKLQNAERAYTASESKVIKYQTSLNKAQTELVEMDHKLKQNDQHLREAEKSSDGLARSINGYGMEVEEAKEKTSVFGDVLKAELAGEMIIGAVEKIAQGIAKIATAAVTTGASFEKAMGQVSATMGLTAEEIANGSESYRILEEAAEESGKATKYSASQAAEALNYLALAGYDAQKAAATLPKVLNLASAGGMELAYASDLVTDAMAALGMETSDLDNYIDEMTKTSQKSNTSIAQLGEATLVTAGVISMTGQSLETMNAELGVLANNGIKGAEGGTHLRNILLRLVSPTNEGAAALKELGVNVSDSSEKVRDLNDIMTDLNKGLSNLSETDQTKKISTIFKLTDLAAVNYLLKGTGEEFDNLRAQLLDCKDAAALAAETMEANLTGKVTILQSALEGLGITAYKRIEGTLKDSVDAATRSVGRLQDSMDSGELGRSVDDFADALDDAAAGAIGFAEDALPALIDGLTWMLENGDLVAAGISGITAATIYHGTVVPMITAAEKAWRVYQEANKGATVSQWLLNTAMSANPAGILITALVGLTAAVAAYALTTEGANAETKALIDEKKKLIESEKQEIEEYRQHKEATEASAGAIQQLKKELLELNAQEKLSSEEKARMKAVTDELNQAMPELNLALDEQTGKLLESSEAASEYIDNMLNLQLLEAAQEDAKNIAEQMYQADKELAQMRDELTETTNALKEAQDGYNQACTESQGWYTQAEGYTEYLTAIDSLTFKEQGLREQMEAQEAVCAELNTEYQKTQKTVTEYTAASEKSAEALGKTTGATVTYKGTVYETTQEVAASAAIIQDSYQAARDKAVESMEKQVGLFDKLSSTSDLTASQMAENLQSQTDTYTTYADNLAKAAELMEQDTTGSFSGIVSAIMAMGMDGAGYLNELITAFESGNKDFENVMVEWAAMDEAKNTLYDTMADVQTGYTTGMDGVLDVHTDRTGKLKEDIKDNANANLEFLQGKNKETVEDAENTLDTLQGTVTDKGSQVSAAADKVARDTVEQTRQTLRIQGDRSVVFEQIGTAISDGMRLGILKGESGVISASIAVAKAAYEAARAELDIHSPSRKFSYLGEQSAEGYAGSLVSRLADTKERIRGAMQGVLAFAADAGRTGYTGEGTATTKTAGAATTIGSLTIEIRPQTLSREELEGAFTYINERLGADIL